MVNLVAILLFVFGCEHSDEFELSSEAHYFEQDCATRLNHWTKNPAACIVIKDNKVLLVYVPYSNPPGWDFPGGHEKGDEFACQTAERETCEETGYYVRVLSRVSDYVFTCEVTGENVCTESVDEGFLDKKWYTLEELDSLQYRDSWGDKLSMMKQAFADLPEDTDSETSIDTGKDTDKTDTGFQQDTNIIQSNDTGSTDNLDTSEDSENGDDTSNESKNSSNDSSNDQDNTSRSSSTGCSVNMKVNTKASLIHLLFSV